MNKTENTLHKKTPSVTVLSNRGQVVRDIVYHRHPDTPDNTDERITRHQFDSRGFLKESADPRLQASGLANFRYITSLSGQVLRTESADAGTSLALNDAAGRPATSVHQIGTENGQDDSSRAVTQTFRYEGADSAGRPLSIAEQTAGQSTQVTERFVYAGSSEAEKAKNLAGICTHHYEPAGLMQTDSIALTGVPLSVTRQLLKDADNPDIAVNWPESDPESLLSAEKYTTQTTADATGAVLNTTDAAGHRQKMTYDIAGLLSTSRVTVKGGAEKIIIKSVMYSAAGQKLREEHGNGVVTTYTYEPQTQRLLAVKTEHPARKKIFQDLRYEYDPVGNVLCVTNDAEETRFWRNQKVVPENRYTYDTLYQLVSATGREMANAGQQSSALPDISPFDKATYTCYTRNYIYDCAGNMTQIRHSAPATNNNYTTDITVSQRSNRAVLKTLADTPEKAEALFTPGGQQTQLQPGQTLSWTARGELQQVTPVVRNGAAGDCESYRYDAGSRRILKTAVQKTGNSTQTQQVIYLPGLELRSGKENYQVICAGVAGRAQVRLLHWQDGKKDHQRFSYDNLIGSSGLETDGDGNLLSQEEYYPFGGTAVLVADADSGIDYKTHRYSGKERDATGLYYYGYRYYQPWAGRWLSSDPAGTVDGLNLYSMVRNNPVSFFDTNGLSRTQQINDYAEFMGAAKAVIHKIHTYIDALASPSRMAAAELRSVARKATTYGLKTAGGIGGVAAGVAVAASVTVALPVVAPVVIGTAAVGGIIGGIAAGVASEKAFDLGVNAIFDKNKFQPTRVQTRKMQESLARAGGNFFANQVKDQLDLREQIKIHGSAKAASALEEVLDLGVKLPVKALLDTGLELNDFRGITIAKRDKITGVLDAVSSGLSSDNHNEIMGLFDDKGTNSVRKYGTLNTGRIFRMSYTKDGLSDMRTELLTRVSDVRRMLNNPDIYKGKAAKAQVSGEALFFHQKTITRRASI